MSNRKSQGAGLVFYKSYYDAAKELDDDDRLAVYDAILLFGFTGEVAPLPKHIKPILQLIMPTIAASKERYETAVANGKKGGAPPGNQNARKSYQNASGQTTEKQPKNNLNTDMDTDKDLDTETDRDEDSASNGEITILRDSTRANNLPYTPLTAEEVDAKRKSFLDQLEQRQREKAIKR